MALVILIILKLFGLIKISCVIKWSHWGSYMFMRLDGYRYG